MPAVPIFRFRAAAFEGCMSRATTASPIPLPFGKLFGVIDVLAVLNALRAAFPPKVIHDL